MISPGRQAQFRAAVRAALAQGRTCVCDPGTMEIAEAVAALVLDRECIPRAHELAEHAARQHAGFAKLAAVLQTWHAEVERSDGAHGRGPTCVCGPGGDVDVPAFMPENGVRPACGCGVGCAAERSAAEPRE